MNREGGTVAVLGRGPRDQVRLLDIDLDELAANPRAVLFDVGWRMSSYELRCGLRVIEQPFDTLPGELQEELLDVQSRKRRSWLDEDVNAFTGRP